MRRYIAAKIPYSKQFCDVVSAICAGSQEENPATNLISYVTMNDVYSNDAFPNSGIASTDWMMSEMYLVLPEFSLLRIGVRISSSHG